MSSNNNRINVPQAKQAMEQFKMQAASDHGVTATYRTPALLRCRNPKSIKNQRYAHPAAQPIRPVVPADNASRTLVVVVTPLGLRPERR